MPDQYADRSVSLAKFEREVAEYRLHSDDYLRRRWILVEAEFPRIAVMLAATNLAPPAVILAVMFDYTNYDAAPPSVNLVKPFTWLPYTAKELPTTLDRALPPTQVQVPSIPSDQKVEVRGFQPYVQSYGPNEVPFLCVQGVREYHDHPAHSGDLWELHRASGAGSFVRILEIVYRYGIEPITNYGVQLVPQIRLNFGPPPQ